MLNIAINLSKNLLAPMVVNIEDKIVVGGISSQKLKILKKSAKSKNPVKLFKSQNTSINVRATKFLNSKAIVAFTQLRQVFIKALIFGHFDPECHIRIETNASSYTNSGILSQLTLNFG